MTKFPLSAEPASSGVPEAPRVLTFNHHEPFLLALAELPARFDVVVKKGALDLSWNTRARRPPENFRLIDFDAAVSGLRDGAYHAVVCHTVKNLGWMFPFRGPRYVFVAHIPLFAEGVLARAKSAAKRAALAGFALTHRLSFVAVSEWKRASWNVKGAVTPFYPVPFPPEKVAREKAPGMRVAVVGNKIASRGEEMGFALLERVRALTPVEVIGNNPDVIGARVPKDFDEFVRLFTGCSIYLYTIRQPQGDGYNTSMLEAMALGMPVVTVPNASSPIVHGENGLVGDTAEALVAHIESLRRDGALRKRLGEAARATVNARFTRDAFLRTWREVLGLER